MGNSFVPSTTNDLLSNQISYLNQTSTGTNSSQLDNQDSQNRRSMTHNFNNQLTINRSNSSVAQHSPQPNTASALFKQQSTFNTSNWSTNQQNSTSGWSTNSQSLLNQPANQQQQTQQSLNTWNRFNTFNSLSNVDKQQPRLSNSNLSANSVSPLKKPNSQLIGSSANLTSQQTLLNTQQLNQLSPSKFRQNRQPLMNVNTLNAMLMMQVIIFFSFFFFFFFVLEE